ncbi:hypothetical protein SAMN05421541_109254 [Actinoplanes philippinensis]|uniref:Uncharacterized protein n=1 Tax=Actinoplanes philippinensis TaxID=35752 RepID=A0A1I2I3E6_9ACTN|nr:hypothetical protein SAMN05421541_109254 [Actinoplanes philippinensis]
MPTLDDWSTIGKPSASPGNLLSGDQDCPELAALLVFGALVPPAFLGETSWTGRVFAILAIFVARPPALWLSFLLRSSTGVVVAFDEQAEVPAWYGVLRRRGGRGRPGGGTA